jgi:hypothetical protein
MVNPGLRCAQKAMIEAQGRYYMAIEQTFPPGRFVTSLKNGRVSCEVLGTSGDRVLVRSAASGKEYWVSVFHIEEAGFRASPSAKELPNDQR